MIDYDRTASRLARVAGALLAAAWIALPACAPSGSGRGEAPTIERQTFINVYVALRRAERETATADAFEARKQQILREHGTTVEELARFVEARGRDVESMMEVWNAIQDSLAPPPPDTSP